MKYFEPATLTEALRLRAEHPQSRCLAGGATLVAMMNSDLVDPPQLIGLRRIPELQGITATEAGLRIGAMTTHTTVAGESRLTGGASVVRHAASQIAHPAIRNMGTIGGSICHADPAADLPGALVAAEATIEAIGHRGTRLIPADEFFVDYFETRVQEDEIVSAILVPFGPPTAAGTHLKFNRAHGDYATVSVSLVLAMDGDTCTHARVAIGSVGPRPLHLDEADSALRGSRLLDSDSAEAGALLVAAADPVDDVRGSSDYRRRLIPRLLGRAIATLREKADA